MHAFFDLRRLFSKAEPSIRTQEVLAPSKSGEGISVVLTAGFILLCVIYTVAFERFDGPGPDKAAASRGGLMNYQALFRDLPSEEQRTFRQMQEGWLEIERLHGAAGPWPDVSTLSGGDIPPFAPDVIDKSQRRWSVRRSGLVTQYVGVAPAPGVSFMLSIAEPEPTTGEKPAPGVVDEEHQLLADGRLLHVTYWKRDTPEPSPDVALDPAMRGWTQIRVKTPLEEIMEK